MRWDRRPHPPSACVALAARPWPRGCPRRRSRAPPFRVFPPSQVGSRFARPWPSWGSPRRVPDAAAEPLQGFDPWGGVLGGPGGPLLPLLGFSPLGRSPPAPWRPVWSGPLLLRASPPVPVGSRRRHPGVLRCAGSGLAVSGAGPSGVCDPWVAREASLAQLRILKAPPRGDERDPRGRTRDAARPFPGVSRDSQQVTVCPPAVHRQSTVSPPPAHAPLH